MVGRGFTAEFEQVKMFSEDVSDPEAHAMRETQGVDVCATNAALVGTWVRGTRGDCNVPPWDSQI